jgi:hypothetical protein
MANPTTNFGWVMPTAANLIGDLPTNFATFGQGVDTTFADLTGGTTDAVLMKQSATTADFKWGGLWAAYTPTFTNFSIGNGTYVARWAQVGKVVFVNIIAYLGSTSSVTGVIYASTPTTAANISNISNHPAGIYDSTPFNIFIGACYFDTTTRVGLKAQGTAGTYATSAYTNATTPMTWANGDAFQFNFWYETV